MSKTLTVQEVLHALADGKTLEQSVVFSEEALRIKRIKLKNRVLLWDLSGAVVDNPWHQIANEKWQLAPKKVTHKMWLCLMPDGKYLDYTSRERAEKCSARDRQMREITWEVEVDDE